MNTKTLRKTSPGYKAEEELERSLSALSVARNDLVKTISRSTKRNLTPVEERMLKDALYKQTFFTDWLRSLLHGTS
jgi:hypothetical protein